MASKNYSVQLVNIRADGTQDYINPITKSKNVKVTPVNNIPEDATDLSKVLNLLGTLAFKNSEIDDTQAGNNQTWSSEKINEIITGLENRIKTLENHIANASHVTIDETGTMEIQTIGISVNDSTLNLNSSTLNDE